MSKSSLHRFIRKNIRDALKQLRAEADYDILNANFKTRREVIKDAAVLSAGLLLNNPLIQAHGSQEKIVILGAGLAGLSCAYELCRHKTPFVIYEAATRVGGRVFTKEHFTDDGMFCELGGELIDSNNKELFSLAKHFGLQMEQLKFTDDRNDLYYFNGKILSSLDLNIPFNKIAVHLKKDLNSIYKGLPSKTINFKNHNAAVIKFDNMSLAEYIKNIPEIDLWVKQLLTVAYVTEFGLDAEEQTALNFLLLATVDDKSGLNLFGESDEAWRIQGGNSKIVTALQKEVENAGEIKLSHRLESIKHSNGKFTLSFKTGVSSTQVEADKIICTIPFSILRNIDGIRELGLSERKLSAIMNFRMGSNSKLMSAYKTRFWLNKELYPHKDFKISLITDLESQVFWDTGRLQSGTSGLLTNFLGGTRADAASMSDFLRAKGDLEKIYPGMDQHVTGKQVLMNWSKNIDSFGSYVCPTKGSYTSYLGSLAQPELSGKILFAGEHVSEAYLGYMNGAVETGIKAARHIIRQK